MPTGMFTKKIHSQLSRSVRTPPSRTPATAPNAPTAPQAPSAAFRSLPSAKVVVRIDSAAGVMIAAPSPWKARAAIRAPSLQATPGDERGGGEEDDADEEEPAPAEEVSRTPTQQQEAAEEERVGADHPLQVLLGEAQVGLNRGQGHVHDRDVEHDHELHQEEQCEPEPFASSGCDHGLIPSPLVVTSLQRNRACFYFASIHFSMTSTCAMMRPR